MSGDPRVHGGRPKTTPTPRKDTALHRARRFNFYWKRCYPEQFSNAHKLARAVGAMDRAINEQEGAT